MNNYSIFRISILYGIYKNLSWYFILLFIAGNISCGKTKTYSIKLENEVNIVNNYKPLYKNKFALKKLFNFGKELGTPWDLTVDLDENIYVFDQGYSDVKKYDSEGKFIKVFGRKGVGPGELQEMSYIFFIPEDKIYIKGPFTNKIIVFNVDGKYLKDIKTKYNVDVYPYGGRYFISGIEDPSSNYLFMTYDVERNILNKFCKPLLVEGYRYNNLVNISELVFDKEGNIYVCFNHQNRIEKYSKEGDLEIKIDRTLTSKMEFSYERERILEYKDKKISVPNPKVTNFSSHIGIDNKNRLWILTYQKQPTDSMEAFKFFWIEVYDEKGILLDRVTYPEKHMQIFKVFNNRIYLYDFDQYEQGISVYEIIEY